MLSYYVIPFFLVVDLSSPPFIEDMNPEYTFIAHVTTTVFLNNQTIFAKSTIDKRTLTVEFKCRAYQLKALMCHKGTHKHYPSETRNLVNISDSYHESVFQIIFNNSGVTGYAIEKTHDGTMDFLLNLYRLFGSQLSIGAELDLNEDVSFESTEQSVMGSCLVHYNITHLKAKNELRVLDGNGFLSPNYYSFEEKEKINISKRRYAHECYSISNYLFGKTFWDEFIPDHRSIHMTSSKSIMTLSKYSFRSNTQNMFTLYDQKEKAIVNVAESIDVSLISIRPPQDFPSMIFLRPILGGVVAKTN